jgi:trehalose 6-phosphate phosphatase
VDPFAAFAPFVEDPTHAGLFFDFDGTLSPIVDDPALAVPLDGAPALLGELSDRFARVGILSGRPVAFVQEHFPDERLELAGIYGLERVVGGRREDHPASGAWREVIADVAASSTAHGPAGMRVEPKGLSITMHYRGTPEIGDAVKDWVESQAARSGLEVRRAKMSFELHPPIAVDKGTLLLELAEDLRCVCFVGDDVGDLPAFDGLDQLQTQGVHTVRVGVRSSEQSSDLILRADLTVDGPEGVADLLRGLRDRVPPSD